ncbi:MAG TPA: hypothetical protein VFX16_37800 [Pseudonocardiaceae bacterium]|nr:hypothetical protein [Pseudonocardiaceae bacterium]
MARLQRFNPWPIFIYNSRANSRVYGEGLTWAERLFLYGVPIAGLLLFVGFRLELAAIPQLLSAIALLSGSMIGVFVFLANLRIKIEEVSQYQGRARLKELVASSAVGALHVAIVSMLVGIVLAVMAALGHTLSTQKILGSIISGIGICLMLHLIISLAVVLRRLLGIYFDLFMGDFMAKPDVDESE